MSLPLCSTFLVISIPCAAKKPFLTPRSSGNPFAIDSVLSSIVASFRSCLPGALAAEPPNSVSAPAASAIVTPKSLARGRRRTSPFMSRSSCRRSLGANDYALLLPRMPTGASLGGGDLLPLDEPRDVAAQLREFGQLLRRDLVARARKRHRHDLLHLRRRVREEDDAVVEVDRLVDVVGDEED